MSGHEDSEGGDDLLGDLESIRTLLDETDAKKSAPAEPDTDDVPLLEDVVGANETSLSGAFVAGNGDYQEQAQSGLNDELFKALLSDEWRESARELLSEARAAIARHEQAWTPAHTDELNAALKARMDQTLQHWLRDTVQRHMDDLRQTLLAAMRDQIRATIEEQVAHSSSSSSEDPNGA